MSRVAVTAKCLTALAVAAATRDPAITTAAIFAAIHALDRYHQDHTP